LLGERYDVEAVADGEAALAAAHARPPDLVLADVMMPRLDGFGLLRALRGDLQTRTIPVILLSARAGEEASVEGLRAGADDYIVKPFSARELLARVAAHLDMARVRGESEQRVTRILDNITDAFQVIDADCRITYMNPMAKEIFAANGLGPAAMIGKHLWNDVFQDSKDDEFATQVHRVMAERIPLEFESYYAPWQRWFRGRIDPLPDGGVAHYFQDITERKKAEQALRESEERFRRYFELGLIGMAITSPTKECLEVNDEICRILGYEKDDLLKKTWPEMTHPDDLAAVVAQFDRVIAGEIDGYTMDKRWLRKDGRTIDTTMSVKCVRRDDGSVDYFIALVQDITERRRAEEALRKSRQALEQADRRKDEFLAVLAHELRNPLASILTGSHLLRRLAHESPSAHETRIMIEREVERLARLVDDLLDVSRITAGRIVLRREPLDLRDVVQRAIDTTRPVVETRRHRVELALPNTPLPIEADVVRLGQVFSNLLNNAAKYTNPGGRIRVSAVATGSEAVVSVSDNGVGIASADLPHIFDLFNRGQRSSDHTDGGLGVGLTLARRLSELHGGSVDAASDGPGCGSEFVVRLPLAASLLAPAPAQPVSAPARPRRILVIDDNESFVAAMSGLLRAMGHEVRTIPDGSAAVATARAFRPHVVLLDIGLPGLSGYAVAHALRQDPAVAAVRIFAITGYGQEQDKRHAVAAGIDQHLTKPVDDTVLATLIDAAGTD
jgi:PAS domain S-box-containing protein